ncbi:hypothetical protein DHEL01_v212184 [Diaporthe helianthi]|uniref:SET domain-containing protein n=1 Tax=Diaporthe helianthi TaxID=158607 RepID=A0A2P5HGQ0_DIAHE|nr:hypothetical protein DHEL01_v212184 [Diaporthe helianthi]
MAIDPDHAYLKINIGPNPPFELRPSPGKGWGAFATRHLAPGDPVFTERPTAVIQKHASLITQTDIFNSMRHLSQSERQQVRYLTGSRDSISLVDLFRESEFTLSVNPPAHGMFLVLSRFNHSCVPNCRIPSLGGKMDELTIQASRAVRPGQELTFTYDPIFQFLTAQQRAKLLNFDCKCPACLSGTVFHQVSNTRRTLLRGLYYLVYGKERETGMPQPARPLLTYPEMMKKAEDLAIPLSTRFIAVILIAFLLEEEGLMDPALEESMLPNMNRLAVTFRSWRNAEVASNVMKHTTFLGRFCAAFKLYGKKDLADRELATVLQESRRNGLL